MKPQIPVFLLCFLALGYAQSNNNEHNMEDGWSRAEYPNPFVDPKACGRDLDRNAAKTYICDPDRRLRSTEASQLDMLIGHLINQTVCPCSEHQCHRENLGYRVAVAIVYKMKPDEHMDVKTDQNEVRSLDDALHMGEMFAYTLQDRWHIGKCDEGVIIFYSVWDNIIYTNIGRTASKKLSNSLAGEISLGVRKHFTGKHSNMLEGLQLMIKRYRAVFDDKYDAMPAPQPRTARLVSANGAEATSRWSMLLILSCLMSIMVLKW